MLSTMAAPGYSAGVAAAAFAQIVERRFEHRKERNLLTQLGRRVQAERLSKCGQRHLVDAQGAQKRIRAQPRDERASACDDPRLRSAQHFVAGERDQIYAVFNGVADRALVRQAARRKIDEGAAAQVFDHRNSRAPSQTRKLGAAYFGGEPAYLKV